MPAEEWYPWSKMTHEEKVHIYRIAHLMRLTDIHFLAEHRLFSDVGYAGELCGTKPERDWEFRCFGVLDNWMLCFFFVSYLPIFVLWFPFFYSHCLFCLQPFYLLSPLWYLFFSQFVLLFDVVSCPFLYPLPNHSCFLGGILSVCICLECWAQNF